VIIVAGSDPVSALEDALAVAGIGTPILEKYLELPQRVIAHGHA